MSTARGQYAVGQEVGTGTERLAPDITTSTSLLLAHQPLLLHEAVAVVSALARTHTRVALCPVSRTQLGWVSAFNPLGGARSLSRKACIHLQPRKAVGFVSGCNGLRTTTDQARTDGRTDGRMDWTGLTAADYHLDQPSILSTHPTTYHIRFALLCRPVPLPGLRRALLHRFQDKHPPRELSQTVPTPPLLSLPLPLSPSSSILSRTICSILRSFSDHPASLHSIVARLCTGSWRWSVDLGS